VNKLQSSRCFSCFVFCSVVLVFFLGSVTTGSTSLPVRGVPLAETPPLLEGTELTKEEILFGRRGKVGGFAVDPDRYRITRSEDSSAIQISYDKRPGPSFVGSYMLIMANLSQYETLSFRVKGKKGGETFEIGLNDIISNRREDAVFVGSLYRYLPNGMTTEWQEVIIPLHHFYGIDLLRVHSLVLFFNEQGKGTFWVDDIRFGTVPYREMEKRIAEKGYLLLDTFDHSKLNLLGKKASTFKKLPSRSAFSLYEETFVGETGRSLRIDYTRASTGFCGYYTLLNEIDGEYYDLSGFDSVSFWVKGAKGGEDFELRLADRDWLVIGGSLEAGSINEYLEAGVTQEWQRVTIPLKAFGKLDLTQMGSFIINFHRKGEGVIFIDDLKFHLR
jgi:hypothetical protein